jgi:uncharacterized protein (TIGR00299 family) protein
MKTLIFDPFSGAAGDMILGSLVDLGANLGAIRRAVESVVDVSITTDRVSKAGIAALDLKVGINRPRNSRSFAELLQSVEQANVPETARSDATAVFRLLAEAESKVHGEPLETLHFHEVGQDDALADVIGCCVALHELAPESILCTPVNVGGGQTRSAHGILPVPAPATLEILKRSRLPYYGNGNRELLTPTGAALLAHFASPADALPLGTALATGYGAGDAETERPNVLRAILMGLQEGSWGDRMDILETNLDDVSGEILGNLFDRMMALGARDVGIIPMTMKKGRPGHLVRIVATPEKSSMLARELMKETGTLGVRVLPAAHRFTAERQIETIRLHLGTESFDVRVKLAKDQQGTLIDVSAEYEDCRAIAEKVSLPLRELIRRTQESAWKQFQGN